MRIDLSNKNFLVTGSAGFGGGSGIAKAIDSAGGTLIINDISKENVINANTKFIDLEKKIKCGKNFIGEYDKDIPSNLTAEEILIRSGNIGSVRIGQKVGVDNYSSFLKKLGLLD